MSKLPFLLGTAVAATFGVAMVGSASAKSRGSSSSSSPTAPSGVDLEELARRSTADMVKQDIAAIRKDVLAWRQASDPETAGALSFVIEQAVAGEDQVPILLDGPDAGSPVLRAFAMRIFQLEGRAPRLRLWANVWRSILPKTALALDAKAAGVTEVAKATPSAPNTGTEADPQPDAATMAQVLDAVKSQDPKRIREMAAKLKSLGFPEAASDLEAMAILIESGQATANPSQPTPVPVPLPAPPVVVPSTPSAPILAPATSSPGQPTSSASSSGGTTARIAVVHKGEGMSQVAGRVLRSKAEGFKRWKEMRAVNPAYRTDKNGNPILQPGDSLNVPASWPPNPAETLPGTSAGPGKQPVLGLPAAPSAITAASSAAPAAALQRSIIVKKGEGVAQVAMRARGKAYTDADRKRLRDFNVPPFKKTPDGSGLVLNPGDKLRIPPEWPPAIDEIMGGTRGRMSMRQLRASRVALAQKFGHDDGQRLSQFQQAEGIQASGQYGPATALVLCHRFGFVPPCPRHWGSREQKNRIGFAREMYRMARRDPQRADEFRRVARQAEGKA